MSGSEDAIVTAQPLHATPPADSSEFLLLADEKISEEDRREILESIEKVAAQNRIPAGDGVFKFTPQKKGFVFPLIINLLAVMTVAGGVLGSSVYYSRKQAAISSQAGTFFSAEGKIIEQVRKESAAKLKAKDQEIASVQAKLTKLDQESATLRNTMQATIQAKEVQLKQQMQSQLVAEKARLQKLGISQTEVARRLNDYEQQKNAQFAQQLKQYKQQNEAALQEKERQIKAQQEQTQKALTQANRERQALIDAAQQQEVRLRKQYEAQTQSLKNANEQLKVKTTAAQQKLQALALQSKNEQLVSDQIVGSYNAILQDIQQAQYPQAKADIASLRTLLSSPSVNSIPSLAKRRAVDVKLLSSLQELIRARTRPGQPTADPELVRRANEVAAAARLVDQADTAQKTGNSANAQSLYAKAIAQVPILQRAYGALMATFDKNKKEAISARDKTIKEVRGESTSKSARIEQLSKRLSNADSSLRSAQSTIDAMKRQIADQSTRIEDLSSEAASRKHTAETLQKQIADQDRQIGDLKNQLQQTSTALAQLQNGLAKSKTEAAKLQSQVASQNSAIESYRRKLSEQTAATSSRTNELSSAKVAAGALQKQLADNEARIEKLQSELTAAQTKIQTLQTNADRYASTVSSIQGDYADYQSRLSQLISTGTPGDIQKARELLLQFIDRSGVDNLLPGFSTVAEKVSSGTSRGLKQTSTGSAAQPVATPTYQLVGTISYISSNRVTVEKLVSLPVSLGAKVLIRHQTGNGNEVAIADGKVTSVSSDSVQVAIETLLHGSTSPQLLDVVYIQSHSGT